MLIEELNKMCLEFVTSLSNSFRNNQNLQMAKLYMVNLDKTSKVPLEFITEYLVDYDTLIEEKNEALFEQKGLRDQVQKWNIRKMYDNLPMSSKETFWGDLDEIVKKVKIILCAGDQLDKFESVAHQIVEKTGIRDLPPAEKTISNVLQKVMTSFIEDPSVASSVGSLMQGLDKNAQERVLKLTGMDKLLPKLETLSIQDQNDTPAPDHSADNAAYFSEKQQSLRDQFLQSSSTSETETETTSETEPESSSSSSSVSPSVPQLPFDMSQMNKQMFIQLAQQLQRSGDLDEVIDEIKANPQPQSTGNPALPGLPANMDFKKIIESLTKENGLLSSFAKNLPKPRQQQ